MALVEAFPRLSMTALAELLSLDETGADCDDVSSAQLSDAWREEATARGGLAIERFARGSLQRLVCEELPEGWPSLADYDAESRLAHVLERWLDTVGHDRQQQAIACWLSLRPPVGWIPSTVDDPRLRLTFAEHWR